MRVRHTTLSVITALAITLGTAACGGTTPHADPSPTLTPTPSSSPTKPAWQSKYNATQLDWYRQALKTWTTYQQRSTNIWAKGQATPAAMVLFKEYFINPEFPYGTLTTNQANHFTVVRQPDVLWSRAAAAAGTKNTGKHGVWVVINQCVDYRTWKESKDGAPATHLARGSRYAHPYLRTIHMQRLVNDWMVTSLIDIEDQHTKAQEKRCSPQP